MKHKNLFHGLANHLDDCFNATQRKFIYEFLIRIWVDIPREGIDWYEAHKPK
jgi:hypothetical protein